MPPLIKTQLDRSAWAKSKKSCSDPSRLPAVDCGLGDYTQWVHLACPHRFRSYSTGPPESSGRKERKVELKPQSTASSRPRSRGLYPVGALSMPPPVQILLAQTEWKNASTKDSKTPSGCT